MTDTEQKNRARAFAAMHEGDDILVLPNAWDAISACVLVDAGFAAVATTSGGCAFALGYCDGEKIPLSDMTGALRNIANAVPVPVSADMEAGYGPTPENVAETTRQTLEAGAVGINIEDSDKRTPAIFSISRFRWNALARRVRLPMQRAYPWSAMPGPTGSITATMTRCSPRRCVAPMPICRPAPDVHSCRSSAMVR